MPTADASTSAPTRQAQSSPPGRAGPFGGRPQIGLRTALAALVILAVMLTAALIHFSWSRTARQNVTEVAGELNREIVGSIGHELTGILANAQATQEALRSIFFQGTIAAEDEAKREFIFLALLRSQPAISWVSFGWPDGNFFGAQKLDEARIRMVEVRRRPVGQVEELRVDSYEAQPGDVMFLARRFVRSDYDSTAQPWYRRAVAAGVPVWSMVEAMPERRRPAIAVATPLTVYGRFNGVIAVVIELERLSRYLAGLGVGKTGTVVIIDAGGGIVAAHDLTELRHQQAGDMRRLTDVADRADPALVAIRDAHGSGALPAIGAGAAAQLRHVGRSGGEAYFINASPLNFMDWTVVTAIPEQDFLANIDRNTRRLVYLLALFTVIVAGAATLLANRLIARPLRRIAGQLQHIESFRLDRISRLMSPLKELDDLSAALIQMGRGLASFQKYLPTEVVRILVAQGVEARPGGHHQNLTVMFTDLAGFTTLSERLGEGIVPVLTDHLGATSRTVLAHGGTIDKFIGDAVMAFWGAPMANPGHAVDACRAAIACRRTVTLGDGVPLSMRIGINTGAMLVGNIGSEERLSYTVIGDAVNLASRLEALNKRYGTGILIGEETRRAAGDAIVVRELDRVAVYGRRQGAAIYELVGMADERAMLGPLGWIADFEAGLVAYRNRDWRAANAAFTSCIASRGEDAPSQLFIERCRALEADPPPADWDGVTMLDSK